jgi:hypothetical protein
MTCYPTNQNPPINNPSKEHPDAHQSFFPQQASNSHPFLAYYTTTMKIYPSRTPQTLKTHIRTPHQSCKPSRAFMPPLPPFFAAVFCRQRFACQPRDDGWGASLVNIPVIPHSRSRSQFPRPPTLTIPRGLYICSVEYRARHEGLSTCPGQPNLAVG